MRLLRLFSIGVLVAGIAIAVLDLERPPADQHLTRLATGAIHLYQATLSPLMSLGGVECRFEPTCSRYAEAVIERDGAWSGGWKVVRRVVRCGPWTPMGTVDRP